MPSVGSDPGGGKAIRIITKTAKVILQSRSTNNKNWYMIFTQQPCTKVPTHIARYYAPPPPHKQVQIQQHSHS